MKEDMREQVATQQFREENAKKMTARKNRALRLVEEWAKVPEIGTKLIESYDKNPHMIENTAIVLENMSNEFTKLSETQISSVYNGLTPENALRVVRLGYPNSNRGRAFYEFAMETAEDGIWYLSPVYASTKRDATVDAVTHESASYRYSSLEEIELPTETPNGAVTTFTGGNAGSLANPPLKPFFVRVYQNNVVVAQDNGQGTITGTGITGTVNYETGAISITYGTAPATGVVVQFSYVYDYERPEQYGDLGEIELRLRKVNFKLRSYRLGLTWSKQSELTLGTTLNIDAEEALLKGAAEELKKSLDFEAFKFGYRTALGTTPNPRVHDADYLSAGADSPKAQAQNLHFVLQNTADDIKAELNRGGITSIVAGAQAANYMETFLDGFTDAGKQTEIGVYQTGTYRGNVPVFKVPRTDIMPTDEIYTIYNNSASGDFALGFGVLLPMYSTQKLEFKNMNSEMGLAEWGDHRTLNSRYIRRVKIANLDKIGGGSL